MAKYRIIIDSKLINSVTKSYFAKGKSDGPVCRVSEISGFWVCTLKKWIENDLFFKNPCSNIVQYSRAVGEQQVHLGLLLT